MNRVFKATRKAAGTIVEARHPTKKDTLGRWANFQSARDARRVKAKIRYEDMLVGLYERATA
jgi:hypothetical protein